MIVRWILGFLIVTAGLASAAPSTAAEATVPQGHSEDPALRARLDDIDRRAFRRRIRQCNGVTATAASRNGQYWA